MLERDKALYFSRGYKYQVRRQYRIKLDIHPEKYIARDFVTLDKDGTLVINPGYAWDGASGPTFDTRNSMIGSLVHDVGYQLIRLGKLGAEEKRYFDGLLEEICIEDGMFTWRARLWRWAVLKFGRGSTRPSAEPEEEKAP